MALLPKDEILKVLIKAKILFSAKVELVSKNTNFNPFEKIRDHKSLSAVRTRSFFQRQKFLKTRIPIKSFWSSFADGVYITYWNFKTFGRSEVFFLRNKMCENFVENSKKWGVSAQFRSTSTEVFTTKYDIFKKKL